MPTMKRVIRFGFFMFYLIIDCSKVSEDIEKARKSMDDEDRKAAKMLEQLLVDSKKPATFIWDLLKSVEEGKISSHHEIQKKMIEIDKSTFITSEHDEKLYFQIVHDREDALSKKKIDQNRELIPLENDEYISESASILYIKESNCGMIQYNRYSVSINQISSFLSKCVEERYRKLHGTTANVPLKIELRPLYDKNLLEAINNNKGIKKIEIRGSIPAIQNLKRKGLNLPIFSVKKVLAPMKGYTFTLTMTGNHTRQKGEVEYDFIDKEACNQLFDAYSQTEYDDDKLFIKMNYIAMNNVTDELVWASPVKKVVLQFQVDTRREIPDQEMYMRMLTYYDSNKEEIERIIT